MYRWTLSIIFEHHPGESYRTERRPSPTRSQTTFERLINNTLSTRDRISLIISIFSDPNEVEVIGHLSGDDAQAFIDVIDEVRSCILQPLQDTSVYLHPNCGAL
jgi:hypothetical protein